MKCIECNRDVDRLINGRCWVCIENAKTRRSYNYKCSDCGGEFNKPAGVPIPGSTSITSKCPFCGKIMEGIE